MRVNIKTDFKIRDRDIRAILLIREAMKISNPHMKATNAKFALYPYLFGVDYLSQKGTHHAQGRGKEDAAK